MKFEIELVRNPQHKTVRLEADDRNHAVELTKSKFPNYRPELVSEMPADHLDHKFYEVTGFCECCERAIFHDEKCATDSEEGLVVCPDCVASGIGTFESIEEPKEEA